MGKRDIEELFKERFKDFQERPDDSVWKSIEASLDKKKQKKRVIPIWWQLGGVAAILAIVLYITNPFASAPVQENTVIETEQKSSNAEDERNMAGEGKLVGTDDNTVEEEGIRSVDSQVKQPQDSDQTEVATSEGRSNANSNLVGEEAAHQKNEPELFKSSNDENETVAVTGKTQKADVENQSQDQNLENSFSSEKEVAVSEVSKENDGNTIEKNIQETKDAETIAETDFEKEEDDKKSIFEAVKEQEEDKALAVASNKQSKWSIGPSVAPVYFNSIGEGSPIHPDFATNSKSGNVNLSYGLTVSYDLGKRLTVRSGIHKVDFGYDTDDIVFTSSLAVSGNDNIENIDYNQASRNLVVESKKQNPESFANKNSADFLNGGPQFDGRMVQQMGYLEVPVELNYALVDKKLGVDLIGGVSSLFLIDNVVSLESDGLVTEMGEANNVNDMNFSTNVGVGLNYEFSEKVRINLEPMFKYQLNTFSGSTGDFRPFTVGVYSGISFKF